MQIVIDISENRYRLLQKQARTSLGREKLDEFGEAVLNGTPLPKGHGRLIDADALYDQFEYADYDFEKTLEYAPTIIEADGGEKE